MVELPVAMHQGQDKLRRVLVARYADHNAVDGSLPFNLDPAALTTGNIVTIGAFHALAPEHRRPGL